MFDRSGDFTVFIIQRISNVSNELFDSRINLIMNTENSRAERWTVTCMNSVFLVTQLFSSVTVIVYQIISQIKPRTGFIERGEE